MVIGIVWFIVAGYVLLLVFLLFFHGRQWRSYARSLKEFEWSVDEQLYLYTKTVYEHRGMIHDFANSVDLLYANKKELLSSDNASYLGYSQKLQEDLLYLEQLLEKQIFDPNAIEKIEDQLSSLLGKRSSYGTIGLIIKIMTLGLYLVWEPRLLS